MVPTEVPDSYLKLLAWFTEGSSGAEVETLTRSYKKIQAIGGSRTLDVLDVFRQFATMNSGRLSKDRRGLLFGDENALVEALHKSDAPGFSLADLGELVGKDKSTISRILSAGKSKKAH